MNMKVCPSCGNYLEEDIQFCTFCGTRLKKFEEIEQDNKHIPRFNLKKLRNKSLGLKFYLYYFWVQSSS
ncbi:MAG: zinc-ribbon domain-containing protein [Candidatus Lokiarchaeota archaeon]|nr:zinc-ribbon domain-containing protein [Candidatus Lokiarchaeota archaeon]MBD3199300.1 zinc-ribbon domain-containing protein [Candidatus Lokiarchaeota archaeon]